MTSDPNVTNVEKRSRKAPSLCNSAQILDWVSLSVRAFGILPMVPLEILPMVPGNVRTLNEFSAANGISSGSAVTYHSAKM